VHPIADLQIEYSLMSRGIETAILPTLRQLGIGVTAYGVLSRGLLGGRVSAASAKGDIRALRMPRFQQGNLEKNLSLVDALRRVGDGRGASPAQLAIAWVRSRGADIVPVVGARRRDQLEDAIAAIELSFDPAELARIDAAVPSGETAGARYDPTQMAHLDSGSTPIANGFFLSCTNATRGSRGHRIAPTGYQQQSGTTRTTCQYLEDQ
jgi:aryl-alcohol dehydrogenase-like predicted oxidoreductase